MAERTYIPGTPECGEWESLLADALDGLLKPEDEAKFAAHKAVCPACAALFDEARKGREWLEYLSPEPEAPAGMLEKILAKTGPGQLPGSQWTGNKRPVTAGTGTVAGFVPPLLWQQPGFFARMRAAMQPRLFMTAAMAFFSIAVTLNITGFSLPNVSVAPLRLADLQPRAMRAYMERQFSMASVPIVRYYDHLRLVYEVEERVREFRSETEGEQQQHNNEVQPQKPGESKQVPNGTHGNLRLKPQESSGHPAMEPELGQGNDVLETSLQMKPGTASRNHAAMQPGKRSIVWIA
jgi:anti-sigma factor RsiW